MDLRADLLAKAARWAALRRGVNCPAPPEPAPAPPPIPAVSPPAAVSARAGSQRAELKDGMALVNEIARQVARQLGGRIPLDDLIDIGNEALVELLPTYDPARCPFRPFAAQRIRWAILDGVRRETHSRAALRIVAHLLDEEGHAVEAPAPLAPSPEGEVEQFQLAGAALAAAATLPPRERALVERHHGGEALQDIARDLGISKSWASRLHGRAVASLRSVLEGGSAVP